MRAKTADAQSDAQPGRLHRGRRFVSARGVPIDEQFLLSWRDFSEANRNLVMRSGTDR
jgi:hypothetical protein